VLGCRQIGLFLGPCFTIFFKNFNFELFGLVVTMYNAPGLLMAILWVTVGILTIFFFYDSPVTIVS
jgi:ceroid-lipofuscinosis MFS transporter 7